MIKLLKEESYRGLNPAPFKPFSKEDWYGYAGAERFENEDEPLIYYDDDDKICMIIDKNGLEVQFGDPSDLIVYGNDVTGNKVSLLTSLRVAKKIIKDIDENPEATEFDICDIVEKYGLEEF